MTRMELISRNFSQTTWPWLAVRKLLRGFLRTTVKPCGGSVDSGWHASRRFMTPQQRRRPSTLLSVTRPSDVKLHSSVGLWAGLVRGPDLASGAPRPVCRSSTCRSMQGKRRTARPGKTDPSYRHVRFPVWPLLWHSWQVKPHRFDHDMTSNALTASKDQTPLRREEQTS